MRKIQADIDERVETGALQINDDWPGLFIRGDDCIALSGIIKSLLAGSVTSPSWWFLEDIAIMIDENVVVRPPSSNGEDR